MSYGIQVNDQVGNLTAGGTRVVRFVGLVNIPIGSTSTFSVSLSGVSFDGECFVYFEGLADTNNNPSAPNVFAPIFSVSGNTCTITARGVGGTCYVGVT